MSHRSQAAVPEAFECEIATADPRFSLFPPHRVEEEVTRTLRDAPGVHVNSLSVHRTPDGICLHGVVEIDHPDTDVSAIIRRTLAIDQVINRMVIKHTDRDPCGGNELSYGPMWD